MHMLRNGGQSHMAVSGDRNWGWEEEAGQVGYDCSQRDNLRSLDGFVKPIREPPEKPQEKCRDISERKL